MVVLVAHWRTVHQMQTEYKLFPGYARQMIRSIGKYMDSKPNNAIARNFSDPYEAFISI